MTPRKIIDGAYLVPMGFANAFILDSGPELVVVDAGFFRKASNSFDAIRQLGRSPRDLKHVVFTHGHPDHIGNADALVRETGATTYMHTVDAPIAESGVPFRPMTDAHGLLHKIMYRLFWHRASGWRLSASTSGEAARLAGVAQVLYRSEDSLSDNEAQQQDRE
jgi:glyoxylase-like metal-dependent hydrolase (beta-lactamase superfamily II)